MKIAFIVQNLSQQSDSVGYDCVYEYKIAKSKASEADELRVFAQVFDPDLHPDVPIESFDGFMPFIAANEDALVVYHFCDGWDGIDKFLADHVKNCFVRWHNNTPPWFYVFESLDFAAGCARGFEIIADLTRSGSLRFLVNSDFSRRQLETFEAAPSRIFTVFPVSPFLKKPRTHELEAARRKSADAPVELLFVGRVVPHKGHRHVLSVAAAVQCYLGRPVRVTFVGSLEQRLQTYWEDLGRIARRLQVDLTLTGLVPEPELADLYAKADAFVCLSEHEGFGMPVFEAMRSHVPVVAWACTAFSDLLAGHPLSPPVFDIAEFAASVVLALDPRFRSDILSLQESILDSYTYETVSQQFMHALTGSGAAIPSPAASSQSALAAGSAIAQARTELAEKVRPSVPGVERFPHDSLSNYVSLYDLDIFDRLIGILRDSKNAAQRDRSRGDLGSPEELHERYQLVAKIMDNEMASLPDLRDDEALLKYDDAAFVVLAYAHVFKRKPQQIELMRDLRYLRRGAGKREMLNAIREGRPPAIPSDPAAAAADVAAHESARRLAGIETNIARLNRYLDPTGHAQTRPDSAILHVDDLLRLNDVEFVSQAFLSILGRAADPHGLKHYLDALGRGFARTRILRTLADSEEGSRHESRLGGLAELSAWEEWPASAAPENRMNRLENSVGRLINQLIAKRRDAGLVNADLAFGQGFAQALQVSRDLECVVLSRASAAPVVALADRTAILDLHQIFIAASGEIPKAFPPIVQENIDSLRRLHPEARYKMWSESELRAFIEKHFDPQVTKAFDALKPFAYKADLARYCLLYEKGGLYSDINNRFLNPFAIEPGKTVACFREHRPMHGAVWMCQNTIIYAQPRQPEIKLAIDLVVANVRNRDYGVSSLAPSGPVLFGRVFAALGRRDKYQIGEAVNLESGGEFNRSCYVLADGSLVAARTQGGGGKPAEMGLAGTNIYGRMWDRREIYGENTSVFSFRDPSIRTNVERGEDGVLVHGGVDGVQIYGPYIPLNKGRYVAIASFAGANGEGALTLDVCGRIGHEILAEARDERLDASDSVSIAFELNRNYDDIEVRLRASDGFAGRFQSLTIVREASDAGSGSDVRRGEPPAPEVRSDIRFIHYILDAGENGYPTLPQALVQNLASARQMHQDAEVIMWTPASVRDFLVSTFSSEVIEAYDRIGPFAMKSEFARCCLLYALGGLYADLNIRFLNPILLPPERSLTCFRGIDPDAAWAVDMAVLAARRGLPEFKEMIERIASHVRGGVYGQAPSSPAGADLLGRVLAVHFRADKYHVGAIAPLTRHCEKLNECFVGPDGKMMAFRMPLADGDDANANAEREREAAWRERRLYKPEVELGEPQPQAALV